MNANLIEKLKLAANQFYMNKYLDQPLMEDKEFDQLREQYESEVGQSVKVLVEWEPGIEVENEPEEPLYKTKHEGDLMLAVQQYIEENKINANEVYCNLKYDGGGIKCIYSETGTLKKIVSQPDEEFGLDRTEQFWNLVPHRLDPSLGIKYLRGEVLCDPDVYGQLARNKANGMLNSVKSQDEIQDEAFIRVYKVGFHDNNWTLDRQIHALDELPMLMMIRNRMSASGDKIKRLDTIFLRATQFPVGSIDMTEPIVQLKGEEKWQADGIVLYTPDGPRGFKFYYTELVETTVEAVEWNRKSNGSYACKLKIDPISLNDKDYNYVSTNGVSRMLELKVGKGAKVKIGLSGLTIPQVIEVVEPSEDYQWPTCDCGYQFSEKDIFGLTLKCGNTLPCSDRVKLWAPQVAEWLSADYNDAAFTECGLVSECVLHCPEWFGYLFFIDRWDPFNKFKGYTEEWTKEMAGNELWDIMAHFTFDETPEQSLNQLYEWFDKMYYYSDLQFETFKVNAGSGLKVLSLLRNETRLGLNNYNYES